MLYYNLKLKFHARQLRNNMTNAEGLIWSKLRRKQLKNLQFYRQRIIGNYIVDFFCPKAHLIIEIDGGHHFREIGKIMDENRDGYLNQLGLKVLRFSNRDVMVNIEGVLNRIFENL